MVIIQSTFQLFAQWTEETVTIKMNKQLKCWLHILERSILKSMASSSLQTTHVYKYVFWALRHENWETEIMHSRRSSQILAVSNSWAFCYLLSENDKVTDRWGAPLSATLCENYLTETGQFRTFLIRYSIPNNHMKFNVILIDRTVKYKHKNHSHKFYKNF